MNDLEKRIIRECTFELVTAISPGQELKGALVSENLFTGKEVQEIFAERDNETLMFNLLTRLRKSEDRLAFQKFLKVLETAGHGNLAKVLTQRKHADGTANSLSMIQISAKPTETEAPPLPPRSAPSSSVPVNERPSPTSPANAPKPSPKRSPVSDPPVGRHVPHLDNTGNITEKRYGSERQSARANEGTRGLSVPEARKKVGECLQLDGKTAENGDIIVDKTYFAMLHAFIMGASDDVPDSLKTPELGRSCLNNSDVTTMRPECAAQLGKLLGGRPTLSMQKRHGGKVFVDLHQQTQYVMTALYMMPGRIKLGSWWLAADVTLAEAVKGCLGWLPDKLEGADAQGSHATLEMDFSVLEWWRDSTETALYMYK